MEAETTPGIAYILRWRLIEGSLKKRTYGVSSSKIPSFKEVEATRGNLEISIGELKCAGIEE